MEFNGLSGDSGQWGPYSPYKPCNHSLYIGCSDLASKVQCCSNSSACALEIQQSWTKPSVETHKTFLGIQAPYVIEGQCMSPNLPWVMSMDDDQLCPQYTANNCDMTQIPKQSCWLKWNKFYNIQISGFNTGCIIIQYWRNVKLTKGWSILTDLSSHLEKWGMIMKRYWYFYLSMLFMVIVTSQKVSDVKISSACWWPGIIVLGHLKQQWWPRLGPIYRCLRVNHDISKTIMLEIS